MSKKNKWDTKGMPKKGYYIPTYPKKVLMAENQQNNGMIVYRSSWERLFMYWCDHNQSVTKWSSEPFAIPYIKPTDFKTHRYYIDFYFECVDSNGGTKKYIVEVKPLAETMYPKPPKKVTEKTTLSYQNRIDTYNINQAKWEAAIKFAKLNNLEFIIITEEDLGI